MVLVIALPDCALRLSKVLSGARYVVQVADGKELRHKVHEHQPDVVVLDWRMGGSAWRAIDEVPAIVSRTATHPHVIAVLPETSRHIEAVAADAGCYRAIDITSLCWEREIARAASLAEFDHGRLSDRRSPTVRKADLH